MISTQVLTRLANTYNTFNGFFDLLMNLCVSSHLTSSNTNLFDLLLLCGLNDEMDE